MQSRLSSLAESVISTAFGFVLSLLAQHFVVNPVWSLHSSWADSLGITVFFTVLSVARQYTIRRVFNKRLAAKRII